MAISIDLVLCVSLGGGWFIISSARTGWCWVWGNHIDIVVVIIGYQVDVAGGGRGRAGWLWKSALKDIFPVERYTVQVTN